MTFDAELLAQDHDRGYSVSLRNMLGNHPTRILQELLLLPREDEDNRNVPKRKAAPASRRVKGTDL